MKSSEGSWAWGTTGCGHPGHVSRILSLSLSLLPLRGLHLEVGWGVNTDSTPSKRATSVQFRRSVMSNSLRPHGPQHARLPCPSPASLAMNEKKSSFLLVPANNTQGLMLIGSRDQLWSLVYPWINHIWSGGQSPSSPGWFTFPPMKPKGELNPI